MATSATFYLNAPSLGSATAVFTDPEMTICAGDGFYSDGVIVRELVSCSLLPQETCAGCGPTLFDVAVWASTSEPLAELPCTTCNEGFTPTVGWCYKVETTTPTPPTTPRYLARANSGTTYANLGSLILDSYTSTGSGIIGTQLTSTLWKNIAGNSTDGPLNRTAMWTSSYHISNQTVGFSVCIDISTTKTYYVGCGFDNYGSISVNGTVVIDQQTDLAASMYASFAAQGITPAPGSAGSTPFQYWWMYPIELTAGPNIIQIIGLNGPTPIDSPAAIGVEVYDATQAELAAITTQIDLDAVTIFTTSTLDGAQVTVGNLGVGYVCPSGYQLSCTEPYMCVKTTKEACTGDPVYDTANVYYSYGSYVTDILLGAINSTSCDPVGTIHAVPLGETIHIGVKNGGLGSVQFGSDEGLSMPCPSDYITYCGTVHSSTGVGYVITANTKVSLTANTTGGSFVTC